MSFKTKKVSIPVGNQSMEGTLLVPKIEGKLPGVLIFPGWSSNQDRYMDRAEELAEAGFLTLVFSFRGCGGSDGDLESQTLEMDYDDAIAGYNFLFSQDNLDKSRIGVYGNSLGSYYASLLSKDKEIKSLVLEAPAICDNSWWRDVLKSVPKNIKKEYRLGTDFSENNVMKAINKFEGLVLVIQHEHDEECPLEQTNAYYKNASISLQRDIRIIKNVGHRLMEVEHRAESNKITVDWFKKTL